jgi:hypothetical protein
MTNEQKLELEYLVKKFFDDHRQDVRDEVSMFVLKGPGWYKNHDPLAYHRCERCNTLIPMGNGCPCDLLGNTKIVIPEIIT